MALMADADGQTPIGCCWLGKLRRALAHGNGTLAGVAELGGLPSHCCLPYQCMHPSYPCQDIRGCHFLHVYL